MRKFLKFVHDDIVYCKYYEMVYILFNTGMRISEFCGLTLSDIDLENKVINIDHQLDSVKGLMKKRSEEKGSDEPGKLQIFKVVNEFRHPGQHKKNCSQVITDGEELKNR